MTKPLWESAPLVHESASGNAWDSAPVVNPNADLVTSAAAESQEARDLAVLGITPDMTGAVRGERLSQMTAPGSP